jgi:hypothetical protein
MERRWGKLLLKADVVRYNAVSSIIDPVRWRGPSYQIFFYKEGPPARTAENDLQMDDRTMKGTPS